MTKQGEARSLFIMAGFYDAPYFGSLFEVKLDGQGGNMGECEATQKQVPLLKPVAQFFAKELNYWVRWNFCSLGSASSTKLCILPDTSPDDEVMNPSLNGYIINIKTRKVDSIVKPPNAPKWYGPAVSAYGMIYFIIDTFCTSDVPDPSFERYDPNKDSWKPLEPFPYSHDWGETEIRGYAVCDGFILFNISGSGIYELWAYDVNLNKWHLVEVKNAECYSLRGPAVVADKTIYALSSSLAVMGFSIRRNQTDKGLVVTCSLDFVSENMERFPLYADQKTVQLVHLGDLNFCLVQSGFRFGVVRSQFLKITTFQLVEQSKINVTHSTVYKVPLEDSQTFRLKSCFTLDCEDIKHKAICFTFKPGYKDDEPTIEEVIATMTDQPKQEEIMGNASSCLMQECEDMESEECEIATPSNQPDQEGNIGSVNFSPQVQDKRVLKVAKRKLETYKKK